jgi:hypothetical protein
LVQKKILFRKKVDRVFQFTVPPSQSFADASSLVTTKKRAFIVVTHTLMSEHSSSKTQAVKAARGQ